MTQRSSNAWSALGRLGVAGAFGRDSRFEATARVAQVRRTEEETESEQPKSLDYPRLVLPSSVSPYWALRRESTRRRSCPGSSLVSKRPRAPREVAVSLTDPLLLTVLSLAPAILIMTTSFTRIIVVLSFIRSALATNQMPPNQVLIGLALFLTFFMMAPTWQAVNENALQPYLAQEIGQEEAIARALEPMREFMFSHTRERDLALFLEMSGASGQRMQAKSRRRHSSRRSSSAN